MYGFRALVLKVWSADHNRGITLEILKTADPTPDFLNEILHFIRI